MTDTVVRPIVGDRHVDPIVVTDDVGPSMTPASGRDVLRVVAGVAAIGVGVIDAAMIGAYAGRGTAPTALALAAVVGLGTGVAVMVRPVRAVLGAVLVVHVALIIGWIALRNGGVGFVRGLDHTQPLRYPDTVALAFSVVVVLAALALWRRPRRSTLPSGVATAVLVPLVAAFLILGGPAAYLAATRSRTETVSTNETASAAANASSTPTETTPTLADGTEDHSHHHVTAKPFDPTKAIDLSGTAGVTMVQQKQAELLLAQTLADLPKFADQAAAEAAGYHSIGDSFTGDEHLINWDAINDSHVLDPNFPESLVYKTNTGGTPKLEAAMFIMPDGYTLDNVPDIGGGLIQWHIHDNLCFSTGSAPQVAGVNFGGTCPAGTEPFQPHPMIHVWITENPCGPFSALEGVGAGQTKTGVRNCDHVHGSDPTATPTPPAAGGPFF